MVLFPLKHNWNCSKHGLKIEYGVLHFITGIIKIISRTNRDIEIDLCRKL